MTPEEPRPIFRILLIMCGAMIIIAILSVPTLLYTYSGSVSSGDLKAQAARTDCARGINAERNILLDARDNAQARVIQATIGFLIIGDDQRAGAATGISTLNADLNAAIARVDALKPTDVLVRERCPSG